MRRSIPSYALIFASVSAILGSGWLFASYYTAKLAGPAAIVAWLLGGVAMLIVAFVFAELCTMLPITGSSTRIPQFSHGTLVSFLFAWIIWLSYAALAPTEAQAVIQYLSYFIPSLVHHNGGLTGYGYGVAILLLLATTIVNIYSLRWLLRCNNFLTVIKIIIPISVGIIVLCHMFTPQHLFHAGHSSFAPHGMHGIVAAIATGGIVFAFNGFKQACEMAGEAKNPHRTIPLAVIGSIVICLIIYITLQFALLSSLTPHNIASGWYQLNLGTSNSPLAAIASQDHLNYLIPFIYIGAIVGPLAAALMYVSSSSRSLYGISESGHIPAFFKRLTTDGNPIIAILVNFILGIFMFAPLPGWNKMVSFLTSLMAVTYGIGPVCLLAMRYQLPHYKRPFSLPFATIWATTAFYICTLLIYWSGWAIVSKLGFALMVGIAVLLIHRYFIKDQRKTLPPLNWRSASWMWPYFIGLTIISYCGNFGGGKDIIPFGWDFLLIAIFCVFIMWLAMRSRLPSHETQAYVEVAMK